MINTWKIIEEFSLFGNSNPTPIFLNNRRGNEFKYPLEKTSYGHPSFNETLTSDTSPRKHLSLAKCFTLLSNSNWKLFNKTFKDNIILILKN